MVLVTLGLTAFPIDAASAAPQTYSAVYRGKTLTFTHVAWQSGERAVGVEDPAFGALLRALDATLTWHQGERNVLITTAEPEVLSFAVGDRRYDVGRVRAQARFAPFLLDREPYLPLNELLAALSLVAVQAGKTRLLEPQITSLHVRNRDGRTTVDAFAGARLSPRILSQTAASIVYEFDGVGSTLTGTQAIGEGVRDVVIRTTGRSQNVRTLVTVNLIVPSAAPSPSGTQVTAVDVVADAGSFTLTVAVSGDATYEWHRLAAPDNRFWIDIDGAHLAAPARDDRWSGHVTAVRVHQNAAQSVRVALSLAAAQAIGVVPSATGVRITVGNAILGDVPRSGNGSIGSDVHANASTPSPPNVALVTPAPAVSSEASAPEGAPPGWKFGTPHPYIPTNPHLIVIDPGHGGSDPGSVYHGVKEKTVNLDIALRLRDVLLARGWQVSMTRTTDTDVVAPYDAPRTELQARDDVANNAGARLFIAIHANAFSSPDVSGTTSYYSKPEDAPLARDVQHAITNALGTHDDGIVKSHLYVTLHAYMPAVLVETAFLSNPGDLARLTSPTWRQRLAEAIADGIETYARENPPPTPPSQ
ncbi:MAG TPA: N-acetylmuramoyl-L-alanine amidase [Candidatus Tyrphobacter sp.]